jgi:hypothetical protein
MPLISIRLCSSPEDLRAALREPGPGPRGIAVRCESRRPGAFAVNPADEAARLRTALASPVG